MWDCESFQEDWGERNKKKESFSVYDHVQGGILLDILCHLFFHVSSDSCLNIQILRGKNKISNERPGI